MAEYLQLKHNLPSELEAILVQIPSKSSTRQVSKPDLDDNKKRWLVLGICVHSIVSPALRQYEAPIINKLYSTLKQTNNIDIQTFSNYLKKYPVSNKYFLNYETINNNKAIPWVNRKKDYPKYDYNIRNAVDFSKLFLASNMAHYTGFDDTCDSSALLGLIVNIDKFPAILQTVAEKVRSDIRNPWAHCNFQEWDSMKYLSSFQLLYQLIRNLQLPTTDENRILGDLSKWEVNGLHFLQGTTIGLELLEEISKQTEALAKYALAVTEEIDTSFKKVGVEISGIQKALTAFDKRVEKIENNQVEYKEKVEKMDEDVESLKHNATVIESRQKVHSDQIQNLNLAIVQTTEKVEQLSTDQLSVRDTIHSITIQQNKTKTEIDEMKENIDEIKTHIEEIKYISHDRPEGKVYFYPPDRLKCFVGRECELLELQSTFMKFEDSLYSQVICGLGGCGKTTLAIEFAWTFQRFYPAGIFWISAESNATLETTISNLSFDINSTGRSPKETLLRTLKWVASLKQKWLLVVDNADGEEITGNMKELLLGTWKRGSNGHILITSRRKPAEAEDSFQVDNCVFLDVLSQREGLVFMMQRTERFDDTENEHMIKLVEELGGLPLALEQSVAFIKAKRCSFSEYMERFEKKRLKLLNASKIKTSMEISKERLAVKTTWQMNMDYIQKESEEEGIGYAAVKVMQIASFLFADDIPLEMFNNGVPEIEDEDLKDALQDSCGVKQISEILTRFSLFQQYRENALSVHRLVQEVIREGMINNDDIKLTFHCAIRMINKALQSTTSPYDLLLEGKEEMTSRGALYLWSKLATNANSLKGHLFLFLKNYLKADDSSLHFNIETVNVLHTTAIFHSVHLQQDEALADQVQMLNIMAAINLPEEKCIQYTSIKIPLFEKERSKIRDGISAICPINSVNDDKLEDVTDIERFRLKGNEAYKGKRYQDAIQYYTEGIRSCPEDCIDHRLLSNRSLMYLKVEDYENALIDANECTKLAPNYWKGYCWKAYAIGYLVKSGLLPPAMEKVGLAAACIAANMNEDCLVEYRMKINYPIVVYNVLNCSDDLGQEIAEVEERPNTTLLLKKGLYILSRPVLTTKSIQIIGIEDGVEVNLKYCLQILRLPSSVFSFKFEREKQIHFHFENISFVSGSAQVSVSENAIAMFFRCKFSNGQKGCDDYPRCNGGPGCVKSPVKCNRPLMQRGLANFPTGESGCPGFVVCSGGKACIDTCILNRCGGGGALSDGDGTHLEVKNSTICNMRQMGIEARNGGSVEVANNVIIDNQFHGITISPRGSGIIRGNVIQRNGQEGILCGGILQASIDNPSVMRMTSYEASKALIVDNIICQNGLSGISFDGGTYEVTRNKIADNWLWGMMIKSRSSAYIIGNDIFENKCGGIRFGTNYSASVIIDANRIRDHSGPDIFVLPSSEDSYAKNMAAKKRLEASLEKIGWAEETGEYSRPPIITNRNVRRNNNRGVQHPKTAVQIVQACCSCFRMARNLKSCGNCRTATYCSKECQFNHWKRHKYICKFIHKEYTIQICINKTEPFTKPGNVRTFESSLKGIREGPPPDRTGGKRFIIKVQSGQEYGPYDPKTKMLLYDRSVTLDITFSNADLYHLVNECGILSAKTFTTKKIFCWASFKDGGKVLCIYTDSLPPFQTW